MFEANRRCVRCAREYGSPSTAWTCAACGANLDLLYDYQAVKRAWDRQSLSASPERTMWRYRPLLPLEEGALLPGLEVGWTPLYRSSSLGGRFGCINLYLKDESRNPTGSLKDRASAMAVARALAERRPVLACASTGNAASSLAGMCASSGFKSVIFVPESTASGKLAQILAFGAYLIRVAGIYDDAFDLCALACRRFGWYNRNTGTNPYLTEGKKTVALEMAEQLGWRSPDWVFVPVGDGCMLGSVHKGFDDLVQIGFVERVPHLVGVQAEGASAIADAALGDGQIRPVVPRTIADGISVSRPRDADKALRAIRSSGGLALKVSDEAILQAQAVLARATGIFVEPASAASFAGFLRFSEEGRIQETDTVVLLLTGSGLKDTGAVLSRARLPDSIPAELEAVERRLAAEPVD